ncbi:uncharacterized protein TNCV_4860361 [Trichonephila clavipes]|nr:uncharacterized protein TNCV_4860361 [Trichonephila clavipes]
MNERMSVYLSRIEIHSNTKVYGDGPWSRDEEYTKTGTSPNYCGGAVVKVSDHGGHVMSSGPVPLKTRRVGERCTLNLSRAETSSRWCGVVVRRGGASSDVILVT